MKPTIEGASEDIDRVYQAYPLKKGGVAARKAISKALIRLKARGESDPAKFLVDKIADWKRSRERDQAAGNFVPSYPYPATWFNGERYFTQSEAVAVAGAVAEAEAKHKKELSAEATKLAKKMAQEMARKRNALASSEAPASIVFELPFPANPALPDDTGAEVQPAVDRQNGDGLRSEPEPIDEGATHPSLFPRSGRSEVPPRPCLAPRFRLDR
jgi:hypothetical protein